ncbi:MAG: DsbA family protein, partial [Gemmobacter sp.]|nr:DsbA family protein [Gemmobacter sp.]
MIARLFAPAALTLAAALPAAAFDLSAMTDAERSSFRAEIRSYLMENPEVLMEAIGVLEQRQQDDALQADLQMLADNADAI